jgi:hypothetical protein
MRPDLEHQHYRIGASGGTRVAQSAAPGEGTPAPPRPVSPPPPPPAAVGPQPGDVIDRTGDERDSYAPGRLYDGDWRGRDDAGIQFRQDMQRSNVNPQDRLPGDEENNQERTPDIATREKWT